MSKIIQMKISLDDIKPQIWRRFIVEDKISLHTLHGIIQDVMGWYNCHLYGLFYAGEEYSLPDEEVEFFESEFENANKAKLNKLSLAEGSILRYVYDYGDNWEHTVLVEKVFRPMEPILVPYCLDGARNCPPEDCGSIPGYDSIVKEMKNKNSKKAQEYTEWLGYEYDPEHFDIGEINFKLHPQKVNF